jgi:hypothetical protein
MKHSPNYSFNMPEGFDQYDIAHFNDNTLRIDTKLKELERVTESVASFQKKISGTLAAGDKQIQFVDPAIKDGIDIDVYSSVWGVNPNTVTVSGNTATLEFPTQTNPIDVAIVIHTWRAV